MKNEMKFRRILCHIFGGGCLSLSLPLSRLSRLLVSRERVRKADRASRGAFSLSRTRSPRLAKRACRRREEGERRTRLRWLDRGEKRANRPRSPLLSCARPPFRSVPWAGEAASDTAPPCRSIPAASRPKPTTTSTSISRRPTHAAATSSPLPSRFDGKSSSLARSRWRRGYRASTRQTRCRACWLRCSAWRARQTDREAGVSFEVCFLD